MAEFIGAHAYGEQRHGVAAVAGGGEVYATVLVEELEYLHGKSIKAGVERFLVGAVALLESLVTYSPSSGAFSGVTPKTSRCS